MAADAHLITQGLFSVDEDEQPAQKQIIAKQDTKEKSVHGSPTKQSVRKSVRLLETQVLQSPGQLLIQDNSLISKKPQLDRGAFDQSFNERSNFNSTYQPSLDQSRDVADRSAAITPYRTNDSFLKLSETGYDASEISNISVMLEKDPAISGVGVLFTEFLHCLSQSRVPSQVFDQISAYEKTCHEQIKNLITFINTVNPTRTRFSKTVKLIDHLYQELYTWRLIGSLFRDRLETEFQDTAMEQQHFKIGQESEKDIASSLYDRESSTRQCQLVIDWLEKNAEDKLRDALESSHFQFSSDSVAWEHTLQSLQTAAMASSYRGEKYNNLVTELDPDAPIRQQRNLADLDQRDEYHVLRCVFCYLRAGKLEEAQKLCARYGQSWRAATLDGWRLWHDPNRNLASHEGELQLTEGNAYRDVWKLACWKMSQDDTFSDYEKAIYAVFSGNLSQLLKVCESWEDCLWAYFRVLVDVRVEQELRLFSKADRDSVKLPAAYWDKSQSLSPEKIFEELQSHNKMAVKKEGCQAFHIFQRRIILNEIEDLLDEFHVRLDQQELESSHLLRFMAHVVLFLQCVGIQVKEDVCSAVLMKYIDVLIKLKLHHLVAAYTVQLPDDLQIDVYSKFLMGITEKDEKQKCFEFAQEAGLDVGSIAKRVVEDIRDEHMSVSEAILSTETNEDDTKRVEAVDWLVFDPSQRREALKQANAIMRSFIAAKKLDCARQVMEKIPADSIDVVHREWQKQAGGVNLPAEDENAVKELLCIRCYLDAHEIYNDWFKHFHHNAPVKPEVESWSNFQEQITYQENTKQYEAEQERWERSLAIHTQKSSDSLYNVLLFPGGWMVDEREDDHDMESRQDTLTLIRRLCLPLVTFMLHNVFHSSHRYKECLRIADVIQSEDHALYTVFHRDELNKLLSLLKDTSICLLDQRKDAFGYENM